MKNIWILSKSIRTSKSNKNAPPKFMSVNAMLGVRTHTQDLLSSKGLGQLYLSGFAIYSTCSLWHKLRRTLLHSFCCPCLMVMESPICWGLYCSDDAPSPIASPDLSSSAKPQLLSMTPSYYPVWLIAWDTALATSGPELHCPDPEEILSRF